MAKNASQSTIQQLYSEWGILTSSVTHTATLTPGFLETSRGDRSRRSGRVGVRWRGEDVEELGGGVSVNFENMLRVRGEHLEPAAIEATSPLSIGESVDCRCGRSSNAKDIGPLLNVFVDQDGIKDLVLSAVPNLNLRTNASKTGVRIADHVAPFSGNLDDKTVGTRIVPNIRASKASERNTGEGGATGNKIGVGSRKVDRHGGTGGKTSCKYLGWIDAVVIDYILDLRGNAEGVTATIVQESARSVHVPASTRIGRLGVKNNPSILLCKCSEGT